MGSERWHDIERICDATLSAPPEGRAALLDELCAGDADLRREVDALLAQAPRTNGFLETPVLDDAAGAFTNRGDDTLAEARATDDDAWAVLLPAGTRLGPYELGAPLGAGGTGTVYEARDTRLERTVAIKVLPPGFAADPDRRARFTREAKTIAGLNHPHICTLHDTGEAQLPDPGPASTKPLPSTGSGRGERVEPRGSAFGEVGSRAADPVSVSYLVMEHLTGETLAARAAVDSRYDCGSLRRRAAAVCTPAQACARLRSGSICADGRYRRYHMAARAASAFTAAGAALHHRHRAGRGPARSGSDRKGDGVQSSQSDGRRLLYARAGIFPSLWYVDLDSPAPTLIPTPGAEPWFPMWFPDGRRVLYMDESKAVSLYAVPVDGTERPRAAGGQVQNELTGSWMPDGSLIYSKSIDRGMALWNLRLDTRPPTRSVLLEPPVSRQSNGIVSWPAVSPEGRYLAYVSNATGNNEVYIRRLPDLRGSLPGAARLRSGGVTDGSCST